MLKTRTYELQNGQHRHYQSSYPVPSRSKPPAHHPVSRWLLFKVAVSLVTLVLLIGPLVLLIRRGLGGFPQARGRFTPQDCPSESGEALLKNSYLPTDIPKILHQTSKTSTGLPPLWEHNQKTWRENHPDWQYHLWLDPDNLKLVEEHFHWFAPTYRSFKNPIMRVDSARYMYMYAYGGVYVDMDVESVKNLGPLLKVHQAVLATMGTDLSFSDSLPNAFLASVPRHPFWLYVLLEIHERASGWLAYGGNWLKVEKVTGPAMLRDVLNREYPNPGCSFRANKYHSIFILGPEAIFPFDWHDMSSPARPYCLVEMAQTFDIRKCKEYFPDAYAVSYWSHSWSPNMVQ